MESSRIKKSNTLNIDPIAEEISMTQVFEAALHKGLKIDSVTFEGGSFLDIGSFDNLERISQNYLK